MIINNYIHNDTISSGLDNREQKSDYNNNNNKFGNV